MKMARGKLVDSSGHFVKEEFYHWLGVRPERDTVCGGDGNQYPPPPPPLPKRPAKATSRGWVGVPDKGSAAQVSLPKSNMGTNQPDEQTALERASDEPKAVPGPLLGLGEN